MSGHCRGQIGRRTFYIAAICALIADQVSKMIARSALSFGQTVELIPGFFYLRLVENRGAAFGVLGAWPPVLILISLGAVIAIFILRKEREKSAALAVSLGLLLGGATGNLIDRVFFGHVTDFLDFATTIGSRLYSWPTFNLADIAITIGGALLVYHMLIQEKQRKPESETA